MDCNYYSAKGCKILTETVCEHKRCSFHKTKEQAKADLKKYPPCNYKRIYDQRHKKQRGKG